MIVDVVESMLCNVTNDQIRVFPDLTTLVCLHVTNQELNECRLSGTVGAEDGYTRREGNLKGDVVQLLDRLSGVLESDFAPVNDWINFLLLEYKIRGLTS